MPLKVLFLVQYPEMAPSPRYRVYQLIPELERLGVECTVRPFIDEKRYGQILNGQKRRGRLIGSSIGIWRRMVDLLGADRFDVIYILKGAVPIGPPILETMLKRSRAKIVFDYDDAIYIHKPSSASRLFDFLKPKGKVEKILRMADQVVVPNQFLYDFSKQFNAHVEVVAEAENTDKLTPRGQHSQVDDLVIGWIGSPSTQKYLKIVEEPINRLADEYPALRFRVVGGDYRFAKMRTEHKQWSLNGEAELFQGLDIGIMPLPMDDWSKAKSGCKLRQYMSAGVPAVATRIGFNCELVQDGETGFLVETEEEWYRSLKKLIDDHQLRNRFATKARKHVESHYAIPVIAPRLKKVLESVCENGR